MTLRHLQQIKLLGNPLPMITPINTSIPKKVLLPLSLTLDATLQKSVKVSIFQAAQTSTVKNQKVRTQITDKTQIDNMSLIITGYKLLTNNQKQVLNIVVYDILAKIDNYQLLEYLNQ